MAKIRIEPFDAARHRRIGFDCGKPALDEFLHRLVSQYEKRRLGKTFVAVRKGGSDQIVGLLHLGSQRSILRQHAAGDRHEAAAAPPAHDLGSALGRRPKGARRGSWKGVA